MAYERLNLLRQVGAKYWQVFLSLAAIIAPIFKVIKDTASGLTTIQTWLFVGLGLFVIIAIRFPKIALAITRLILGPPKSPSSLPTIFKGPRPYSSKDRNSFPGRQREVDDCLAFIKANPFFIIDGESGCGKSSILNAALLPEAREKFRVVECRIADDPFGKLRAALLKEPYRKSDKSAGKDDLNAAIALAVEGYVDEEEPGNSRTSKPLLLCIDQFEELFSTVKDDLRNEFLDTLRQAIGDGRLRLIVALRSDFFDLLMRLCDAVDPEREVVNLGNYYTLRAFRRDHAEDVLNELLKPIFANEPGLEPQIQDFAKALIRELLRPPRDKRLSRADEKTVLPVELQTVGMMIESSGLQGFSVTGLKRLGGKIGLLKAYIEEAKIYVWRKTAVSSEKALLILRQLISPAMTKWARTPQSIAVALNIPFNQVEKVLDAFADRYLVNLLPVMTDETSEETAEHVQQYELMHEHLVQILVEAPDPILQRARDAEERLRFWSERTKAAFRRAGSAGPLSFRATVQSWLAQPIPLVESLRLIRYARGGDERKMIRRSLRGFGLRVAIAMIPVFALLAAWIVWTRTDAYLMREIQSDAPITQAMCSGEQNSQIINDWIKALAYAGNEGEALRAARSIEDTDLRFQALASAAEGLAMVGSTGSSKQALDESLIAATNTQYGSDIISSLTPVAQAMGATNQFAEVVATGHECKDSRIRHFVLAGFSKGLAKAGKIDEALVLAREIQDDYERASALLPVIEKLIKDNQSDAAIRISNEALGIIRSIKLESNSSSLLSIISERLIRAGGIDIAMSIIPEIKDNNQRARARAIAAEHLGKTGRVEQAKSAIIEALKDSKKEQYDTSDLIWEPISKSFARNLHFGVFDTAGFGYRNTARILVNGHSIMLAGNSSQRPRDEPIIMAIKGLIKLGKIDEGLATARKMKEDRNKASALGAAAEELAAAGMADQARKISDEALWVIRNIKDESVRANLLSSLAERFIKAGNIDNALALARDLSDDQSSSNTLAAIAERLGETGKIEDAFAIASEIKNDAQRASLRASLVRRLAESGKTSEALAASDEINYDYDKSSAFAAIAGKLASLQAYRLAWSVANRCSSPTAQLRAYTDILTAYAKQHNPTLRTNLENRESDNELDADYN